MRGQGCWVSELFIGRTGELEVFRQVLTEAGLDRPDSENGRVVLVRGLGGIGKTTLLRRFEWMARGLTPQHQANGTRPYVTFRDWRDAQGVTTRPFWWILSMIYEDVAQECGRTSVRAFARFRDVITRMPELFARAQALGLVESSAAHAAADQAAAKAVGSTVGAGMNALGVPVPADAVGQALSTVTTAVRRRRGRGRIDPKLFLELVDQTRAMVDAFAEGMRAVSKQRPVVVLLDTCELLGDAVALGEHNLLEVIRRSGPRTVWALALRLEDSDDASAGSTATAISSRADQARIHSMDLRGFDERGVHTYLTARLGESRLSAAEAKQIAAFTRGVPVALVEVANALGPGHISVAEILAPISPDGNVSEIIRAVATRYLAHTASVPALVPERHRLYALSLTRSSAPDPGLLAALWGIDPDQIAAARDALIDHHDFMLGRRRVLHQDVRDAIRVFLLAPQERVSVRAANARAVAFLADRLGRYRHAGIDAQLEDDEWCTDVLDLVWHVFWQDQRAGIELCLHLLPVARLAEPLRSGITAIVEFFAPVSGSADQALLRNLISLACEPVLAGDATTPAHLLRTLERIGDAEPPAFPLLAARPALHAYRRLLAAGYVRAPGNPLEQAVDALRQAAIEIGPGDGPSAAALATTAREIPPWDIAGLHAPEQEAVLALWRIACAYQPGDVYTHYQLGVALHRLRRFDEAVDSYQRAIELATAQTGPYSVLGLAYLDLGRYDDALRAQQTAVGRSPGDPLYRGNLAECLWIAFGDAPQAERQLREAVALNPDLPDLWSYLGRVLLSQAKDDEARAALERAARNPFETSPWLPLLQAAASPDPQAGDAARFFQVALERSSQPKPEFLAMSGFGWAECGALALAGLGRADEAEALLAASVSTRCGADLFQRTIYDRLAAVMPAGALDGVLKVWRAVIAQDPTAAGPFGFEGEVSAALS